ncbi:hypothetical protein HOLleu_33311 [Holothuria leucospilota]|uniref:Sulfotransferase family protein n=1 Tax=Holothuria leucospilota TaxID=206669 RepID=A0A9Q0YNE5_HOLLE|nr:hypothetical protein HOLleu_33311 [Holothuria leucospilota]
MTDKSAADQTRTFFIWMVPRTNSTALMKCMTFVDDVRVWMEPYMCCYFNETFYNPNYRKGEEVVEKMRERLRKNEASEAMKQIRADLAVKIAESPNVIDQKLISYSWVKKQLEMPDQEKRFVFVKDQSFVLAKHPEYLPNVKAHHTFLIRHPLEMYISFQESVRMRMTFDGIPWEECRLDKEVPFMPSKDFYKIHYEFWQYLARETGSEPIIIDSHDLRSKPEVILPKWFDMLGIPFKSSYLEWDGSDEVIHHWKGSADFVYLETQTSLFQVASKSSRFRPPPGPRGTPSKPELKPTPELEEYIEAAMPIYEKMFEKRLH